MIGLQLRDMNDRVIPRRMWEFQIIGNHTDTVANFEGSKIAFGEFLRVATVDTPLSIRLKSKEDQISYLKGTYSSFLVRLILHSLSCSFEVLFQSGNKLLSLLQI